MNAGLRGHVLECAVAAIVIQNIAPHSDDEQVGVTIVIVVRRRDAHAVTFALDACFFGDVFKRAVSAIAVETIPVRWIALAKIGLVGAVGEEDVQPSVPIVVEQGNATRHRFNQMPLRGLRIVEDEANSSARGHILENDGIAAGGNKKKKGGDLSGSPPHEYFACVYQKNLSRTWICRGRMFWVETVEGIDR